MTLDELIIHLEYLKTIGTPGETKVLLARANGYDCETEYFEVDRSDVSPHRMRDANSIGWKFVADGGEPVLVIQ